MIDLGKVDKAIKEFTELISSVNSATAMKFSYKDSLFIWFSAGVRGSAILRAQK